VALFKFKACLVYIQEFYEVTLLNTQKSCEQKLEEVNHMADKWEKSVSVQNSACPVEEVSLRHSESAKQNFTCTCTKEAAAVTRTSRNASNGG
uniref:Uncharacterized protein n=1 Tax=Acanthochromis polyacanthus TaxID=80966 RepID=A0A3Q1H3C1_9TELE